MTKERATIWDETAIAILVKGRKAGDSATEIARAISRHTGRLVTRNAVIGRTQRMGLQQKTDVAKLRRKDSARELAALQVRADRERRASDQRAHKEKSQAEQLAASEAAMMRRQERMAVADPFKLVETARDTVTRRMSCECAWPVGDDKSCCAPTTRGSYCGHHAAMAYQDKPVSATRLARDLRRYL